MTEIKAEIDFVQLAQDVACIKQALVGNGQPGLCKRVQKLEDGIPKVVMVFSAIGVGIGSIITFIVQIFKA